MFDREFHKKTTAKENDAEKLNDALKQADTVIVGAGAGLSVSAGFTYAGPRFREYFGDFAEKYDFRDMYSGGFYPFDSLEEHWAYWSRYILINRYMDAPKPAYRDLLELLKEKDYFVLTTNVDHCFQLSGFDKSRLFCTQGDFGLFQCSEPCCQKTYANEAIVRKMFSQQKDMKIPAHLIPRCPVCSKPMSMNLRADQTFVEDEEFHLASERYAEFLDAHKNRKTLFLELGVGMNTPGIVKFSFWRMVHEWPDAVYACVNLTEAFAPDEIQSKSICINGDILAVLEKILLLRQSGRFF